MKKKPMTKEDAERIKEAEKKKNIKKPKKRGFAERAEEAAERNKK